MDLTRPVSFGPRADPGTEGTRHVKQHTPTPMLAAPMAAGSGVRAATMPRLQLA
jgi:hypothetical protein